MMPSSAKLIVHSGPTPGQEFSLDQPELVIGREPASGIHLDTPLVSRRHAHITRHNDDYTIEDLGSRNGTYVNGQKIEAPRLLKDGDRIEFGPDVRLAFINPRPVAETIEELAPTVEQA